MSTPGGYEYGENTVAARLSIDIPTEGISQLRELVGEIDRYRTAAEQATRGSDNFNQYLKGMAEAGMQAVQMHQQLANAMERTLHLQERMSISGGSAMSTGVPAGTFTQPFQGNQLGMGMGRHPTNIQESTRLLDQLAQQNPRQYVNYAAQHGAVGQGIDLTANTVGNLASQISSRERQALDEEFKVQKAAQPAETAGSRAADLAQKAATGSGATGARLASAFMNEMGPGGSHLGMAGFSSHMMQQAGAYMKSRFGADSAGAGEAGGPVDSNQSGGLGAIMRGLGPLGKGLGIAGGILGGVATGAALIGKGGQMIQGYHNIGAIRGGGAEEGFEYDMQARQMALNPFITTEQSRQVIQAGLSAGYSKDSKQWDSVTDFIKNNLVDMNMSIGDSFKLLRTNSQEGGSSLDKISDNLKETFKWVKDNPDSLLNFKDLTKAQEGIASSFIRNGVGGDAALSAGSMFSKAFADDPVLKGLGPQFGGMAASGKLDSFLYRAAAQQGIQFTPDQMVEGLGNAVAEMPTDQRDALYSGAINQAETMARQGGSGIGPHGQARALANSLGITPNEALKLLSRDGSVDLSQAGEAGTSAGTAAVPSGAGGSGTTAASMRGGVIDQINAAYGVGGWEVVDGNGNPQNFNPQDQDMVRDIQSGKLQYRRKGQGGAATSLAEMPTSGAMDDGGQQTASNQLSNYSNAGTSQTGRTGLGQQQLLYQQSPASTTVQLQLDKGILGPSQIQISPQEAQANAGYGVAQNNNPEPGVPYTPANQGGSY